MVSPCSLAMCFFCPFSILITLLVVKGAGFCAYRALFVSYAHVNLCHSFSSTWCQGLAASSACGSFWTFLFTFFPLPTLLAKKFSCCVSYRLVEVGDHGVQISIFISQSGKRCKSTTFSCLESIHHYGIIQLSR